MENLRETIPGGDYYNLVNRIDQGGWYEAIVAAEKNAKRVNVVDEIKYKGRDVVVEMS